jgi:transposase
MGLPEPWRGHVEAAVRLVDHLDDPIEEIEEELRQDGADHHHVPLLMTVPGIGWVLAYTIAAEIGDISRVDSAKKHAGYSGLCPRVYQSGGTDHRGPLRKNGPRYLRWALVEAAGHAKRHPTYRDHYQATARRLGRNRAKRVARVELARRTRRGQTREPFRMRTSPNPGCTRFAPVMPLPTRVLRRSSLPETHATGWRTRSWTRSST